VTACKGYARYNNGRHVPCDRPAAEGSHLCEIHQQAAATDPYGVRGWVAS